VSKWKLHPSGEITPLRVSEKIGDLMREGYPQQQAVKIAHAEARRDWSAKHKGVALPTWLRFSSNPVSEETAHKVRKAAPDVFKRLTDEEIKEGLDMLKSKKRRKNPVGDYSRREYVNRKSQITKKSPSKRLKKRRGSNFDKPSKGRFPNPVHEKSKGGFKIHVGGTVVAWFPSQQKAIEYAKAYANKYNKQVKVVPVE
jgi:uncharacterized protein YdaT